MYFNAKISLAILFFKPKNWFQTNNNCINWPSSSPDLKIIENVWNYLDNILWIRSTVFSNVDNLLKSFIKEWYKISKKFICDLYFLVCARIKKLLKKKVITRNIKLFKFLKSFF